MSGRSGYPHLFSLPFSGGLVQESRRLRPRSERLAHCQHEIINIPNITKPAASPAVLVTIVVSRRVYVNSSRQTKTLSAYPASPAFDLVHSNNAAIEADQDSCPFSLGPGDRSRVYGLARPWQVKSDLVVADPNTHHPSVPLSHGMKTPRGSSLQLTNFPLCKIVPSLIFLSPFLTILSACSLVGKVPKPKPNGSSNVVNPNLASFKV